MRGNDFLDKMELADPAFVEAADAKPISKKRSWVKWVAMAACLCLVVGGIFELSKPPDVGIDYLLAEINKHSEVEEEYLLISDYVAVGNRIALYSQIYRTGSSDNLDDGTSKNADLLAECIGEVYQENAIQVLDFNFTVAEHGCTWYYPTGSTNLKYLIKKAYDGELSLWLFRSFLVDTEYGNFKKVEHEVMFEISACYEAIFPGSNRSPYSYGELYSMIYGIDSAESIVSITAMPSVANNTDLGKQIQNEVGTHTYTNRADIEAFYNSTKDLLCYGENCWGGDRSMSYRFTYSFSTNDEDKLISGEETYGSRYLSLELADGTTIDSLKYDALRGCIYEFYGIISEAMSESSVFELNDIFGIH